MGLCSDKQLQSLVSTPIVDWIKKTADFGDAIHITDCVSFASFKQGFLKANPGEPIKQMKD